MPLRRPFGPSRLTCFRSKPAPSIRLSNGSKKAGYVSAKWAQTDANQRARFYKLTPAGKQQLLREQSRWSELVDAIGRILKPGAVPGASDD